MSNRHRYSAYGPFVVQVCGLFLFSAIVTASAGVEVAHPDYKASELERAIDVPLHEFVVDGATVHEFIETLRMKSGLAICYVSCSHCARDEKVTLNLSAASTRDILNLMIEQAPTFTWADDGDGVVFVLPITFIEDQNSLCNQYIEVFVVDNEPFPAALSELVKYTSSCSTPISGVLGTTRSIKTEEGVRLWPDWRDGPISVNIQSGSLLTILGSLYKSKGHPACFSLQPLSSGFVLSDSKMWTRMVETEALWLADRYYAQPGARQDEAIALYEAAFWDAPYEQLRLVVLSRLGKAYLGDELEDSVSQPGAALDLFDAVLSDAEAWEEQLCDIYGIASEGRTRALCLLGDRQRATEYLDDMYNSDETGKFIGKSVIRDQILMAQIIPGNAEESLRNLEVCRDKYTADIKFRELIDEYIALTQLRADSEIRNTAVASEGSAAEIFDALGNDR